MRVFLDTDILVYRFDRAEPVKRQRARDALGQRHEFHISTQVLVELFNALTRRLARPLTHQQGHEAIRSLEPVPVVGSDRALVVRAIDTASRFQLSIWDALIVEAASEAACDEIWSEDLSTGATIRGVRIVNPLARADQGRGRAE